MMELNLLAPEDLAKAAELMQESAEGKSTGPDELTLIKKDGSRIIVEINTSVVQRHGQPVAIGFVRDITERKQAEEEFRESERRYRELYDFLPIPVYEMDLEANITAANRAIFQAFRATEEDVKNGFNAWKLLSPEDVKKSAENIQRLLKGDVIEGTEYVFTRLDGSTFPAIVVSSVIFDHGRPVGLRGAVIDITERKQAEDTVQATLREKEILLREIHHRVKNNMQVISSLFNLEAGYITAENARRVLKEGQLRIRSMALVHERLYQSRDLSKIDFADYIRSLAAHLFHFFRVEAGRVRLETKLESIQLRHQFGRAVRSPGQRARLERPQARLSGGQEGDGGGRAPQERGRERGASRGGRWSGIARNAGLPPHRKPGTADRGLARQPARRLDRARNRERDGLHHRVP